MCWESEVLLRDQFHNQPGMQRYFGGAYFGLPLDRYFKKSIVGFGVWFFAHGTAGSVCVALSCFLLGLFSISLWYINGNVCQLVFLFVCGD